MTSLGPFDWLIFGGYVFIVFALGIWFARGQHTNEDFFVGGRKMNWMAVGLSLFAGTFSSLSFVGLPRAAAYEDYHLYLAILFIPFVAAPLLWFVFVPLYYRIGSASVYEYLDRRFNRTVRRVGSLLFAGYAIGWMGNLLYAVGIMVQAVLDLTHAQLVWTLIALGMFATLYTALGGVKAVIWTDVLQAITLGGGMLYVLFLIVARIDGGWDTAWQIAVRDDKFAMFNTQFDLSRLGNIYSVFAFGIFVYVGAQVTSFSGVQRYMSMPSLTAARRSLIVNSLMIVVVCGLFFLVGTALYAFYHQSPGVLPGEGFPEDLEKQDQLVPRFILSLDIQGLTGLLLAGLFAAAMSSVDTGINSLTATLIYDWLGGRNLGIALSRIICAVFGIAVILSALGVSLLDEHVFNIIMKISGTFLGPLFGVFLLGLLIPWANPPGACVGLLAAAVTLALVWQGDVVSHWWYGAYACIPTFSVGTAASFFFPPPRDKQLDGLCLRYGSEPGQ